LFFNLLGYPTHFGQFECIKCVSSTNFTEKRIGYLGLSQLMDESTEILMMVTQSISKDLNNKDGNAHVICLALTAIAEISTSDMCKSVYMDVKKQMRHSSNAVKVKACLAALRTIKQMPEAIDDFLETLDNLIYEKSQSVLMATVTFMIEICRYDKKYA
jgi:AP-1 complex subunit gamma-1